MGKPLKHPPVYYTLAQVRFNPVLKLKSFLADIQEGMRCLNFPDYRPETVLTLQVGPQGQAGVIQQVPAERFIFGNVERTQNFVLTTDALAFQSTRYGQFEDFSGALLKGLAVVHEAIHLNFCERIGLRYLDRVVAGEGEQLSDYLVPEVLGLAARLDAPQASSYTETRAEMGAVKLVSRTIVQTGPVALPPDLDLMGLQIEPRFGEHSGLHAVIDNDGFVERREPFSTTVVDSHLAAIHKFIRLAFEATATPHAFTKWGK
jgi:uncharacterized protein (TIGR04255 family)